MSGDKQTVFISYSHEDEACKEQLVTHLGVLKHAVKPVIWHDRCIDAGKKWDDEIRRNMTCASVAILLISPNFLNSDYIREKEVSYLRERQKQEQLTIVPFIIRDCAWEQVEWLRSLQVLPPNGRPVLDGDNRQQNRDMKQLVEEICKLLRQPTTTGDAAPEHVSEISAEEAASPVSDETDAIDDETVLRAKNIASAALAEVWENLKKDEEPYISLRAALAGGEKGVGAAVAQIKDMMMQNVLHVLGLLHNWLLGQKRVNEVETIRNIVDVFAAAGMDPAWLSPLRAKLQGNDAKQGNIRIDVPKWADFHLSEVILSAIYDRPAIWAEERYLDLDFTQVEPESQTMQAKRADLREQVASKVFGPIVQRSGESEGSFEARLKQRRSTHLTAALQYWFVLKRPYYFLLDETAVGVREIMAADSGLWRFILCMQQTFQDEADDLKNNLLRAVLTDIFTKLDMLRENRKPGGE